MRIPAFPSLPVILFYWMYFYFHIPLMSGQCLEHQRSLLLQLKKNFTSNTVNSTKLVSWSQSSDCCLWSGVTCDVKGQVICLDLSGQSINDKISDSSSLFDLKYLQNLNLAFNDFNSVIPSGFQNLARLSYLNLSNAGFVGQIPVEISNLTSLVTLDMSGNLGNLNLRKLVRSLTKVRELYLDGINILDSGNEWCHAMSSLPNLQILSMTGCNLQGAIDSSLEMLKNLSIIRLGSNNLSGPVPEFFAKFQNLTILDLNSNGLNGLFPKEIFQVRTLSFVDLSHNIGLQGSLPDFPENGPLQTLSLSHTNFSGAIPASISNLRQLLELGLSKCQFNGALPDSMSKLTELTHLDLSSNNLEGPIPLSIFELWKLDTLKLSFNKFSGEINLGVIQKLPNLTELDFSYNNLSIIDTTAIDSNFPSFPILFTLGLAFCSLKKFPQYLRNQSTLCVLDLSNNHIHGSIPHWIWGNNSLIYLNLSHNYLTDWEKSFEKNTSNFNFNFVLDLNSNNLQGSLPVLPQFATHLDFSNNNLSSVIPPDIGNFILLTSFLSFSSNSFHGSIPQSICNASQLQLLDLSGNSLSGTIPKCLIAMNGTLRVLNLRRNKLSGSINTFSGSCELRTLDLNGNFLQGKLPKYLVNCSKLEVFDLGNNQMNGIFPCWLKSISTLRVLILRFNMLQGSLKCSKNQASSWLYLQIFDIASNNFSSRIPPLFFNNCKAMMADHNDIDLLQVAVSDYGEVFYQDEVTVTSKDLQMELVKILTIFTSVDLSCNNFEGSIPAELGQLKALHTLNLSQNAFISHIPSSFGNLTMLESLDLSRNKLSGTIPAQLADLTFL